MKKYIIVFIAITIIFFGMLFKIEYATDTYQVFNFTGNELFWQFASSGRFVTAFVGKIVKYLNLSEKNIYSYSYILAIVSISISQYKLYKIVKKDVQSKILNILIPTLIIINPFSIELFLFVEKGIMVFGILMTICALENLIKYFEYNNQKKQNKLIGIKYLFYSLIYTFFATFSYQGVIGLFVAISFVYILKYSKNLKDFLKNNIIVGLIYGLTSVTDYLIIKVFFFNARVNGNIILGESIKKIYENTIEMIKFTYNILPKYMFFSAILFTFCLLCYKIIESRKNLFLEFLKYFYIVIGIILISILPQFIQSTSSIWFAPRSTYPFAALYGILILYLIMNFKVDKNLNQKHSKNKFKYKISFIVTSIISLLLLFIQLERFIKIEKDRYILNEDDYVVSQIIIDEINDYEINTGKTIKKIEIYQDSNPRYSYDEILTIRDTNIKAYSANWSTKGIIEYYLGRRLENRKIDEDLKEKFMMLNWDAFDFEQIILKDDILILCRY